MSSPLQSHQDSRTVAEPSRGAPASPTTAARLVRTGAISGLALGALSGHADVLYSGLLRVWMGRLVFSPEWFWWAAPWLNGLIVMFITVAGVVLLPQAFAKHRDIIRFAVPLTVATLGVLLIVPGGLHRLALIVLAVGLGIRGGAVLAARARLVDRVLTLSLPVLLLLAPIAAVSLFGLSPSSSEASAGARRSGLPNIIIIVLDTVRAIELSLYGSATPTSPVIDELGANGVVFERASSTAPWTLPSHASLFTGRWAHELPTSLLTPLDRSTPTLAEVLTGLGYRTGAFSANTEYASAETGIARGFSHYQDHRASFRGTLRLTRLSRFIDRGVAALRRTPVDLPGRVDADLINRRFTRWLRQDLETPFFAFLNYYDAHAPYHPPQPQWSRFVGDAPRRPVDNPHDDAERMDRVALQQRAYAGAINFIDERLGMLMDSLRSHGLWDNTLIIVTSDHGEEFAEHGILGHGNTLYYPSVHVPLVMHWTDVLPAGCRIRSPVSIRDIPATIMDLIGERGPFPGRNLATTWSSDGETTETDAAVFTHTQRAINQPAWFPASRGPLASVELWPYRLIAETDPVSVSLFRHDVDAAELHDLAGEPAAAPALRVLLDSLAAAGFPLETAGTDEFDGASGVPSSLPGGCSGS